MDTRTADVQISIRHEIVGEEAEQLWAFYNDIFGPLNEESPCRQSLHHGDFIALLGSAEFVKFVARDANKATLGFTAFATLKEEMPLMPWISTEYFRKRWPEFWGRIIYVPIIGVPRDARALGAGKELMLQILQYMREHSIPLIGFDHSVGNIPYLPDLIMRITNGKPMGSLSKRKELDSQAYYLLRDQYQLPEE